MKNNTVPNNITQNRKLKNRNCKITNYFTHQTKNWIEVKIVSSESDIFSSNMLAKNYLLRDNVILDEVISEMSSQFTVLFLKLGTTELHSGLEYYSIHIFLKYILRTLGKFR